VKIRLPFRLAAASGLWLSSLGFAQEPARLPVGPPVTVDAAVPADQRKRAGVPPHASATIGHCDRTTGSGVGDHAG